MAQDLKSRLPALRRRRDDRQVGIERAFADLDRKLGDVDAIHGGEHRRTLLLPFHDRPRERAGRQPVDRRAGPQPAGIDPDHAAVVGLRGDVVRLRAEQRRAPRGQPRFRLGDVGARHLADIETVARLFELLGQHFDVAAVELEDRRVAQQIHVGGGGIEQHLLLGDAERFARPHDLAFRLARPVGGLQAVEQRVGRVGADDARIKGLCELGIDSRARDRKFRGRLLVLGAAAGGDAQLRPIAGQRLRHVLVGGTQRRALRVERRVVLIGLHQRPFERVRRRLPADQAAQRPPQRRQWPKGTPAPLA